LLSHDKISSVNNEGVVQSFAEEGNLLQLYFWDSVSECQPTAPLLPFRPGGFGKPHWQLVD
jgi:hypothetical protein